MIIKELATVYEIGSFFQPEILRVSINLITLLDRHGECICHSMHMNCIYIVLIGTEMVEALVTTNLSFLFRFLHPENDDKINLT